MTFFFYFLGYDTHDGGADTDGLPKKHRKRQREVQEEEDLLRYLLKQQGIKPSLRRKLDKDSIRETLERHFKGEESNKILELVAQPEVRTARDLFRAWLAVTNTKRIQVLMALIMLDEDEEQYEH
jgi:hypothetical protein